MRSPCLDAFIKEVTEIEAHIKDGKIELGEALLRHNFANSRYWECVKGKAFMKKYIEVYDRISKKNGE
jgi:hypothetical protein